MNGYLLALTLYGAALLGAGLFLSRHVRTAADFFVAGRKLNAGLLFTTLLMANIGAGSTIGAASLGYRLGMSGWWWVGSAGIGTLILAFTVGPRIWRVASDLKLYTAGDYLERRYGSPVRTLVAVLLWFGSLAILAGQLIAFASILSVVAGTAKATGCVLGGVVAVVYFSLGGLRAAVWINLLQLVVTVLGFALGLPFALAAVGGWSGLQQTIAQQSQGAEAFFSPVGIGAAEILAYLALLAPSFIVSPGLLQKIYGGKDESTVRWGTAASGAALLLFAALPVVFGMIAQAVSPGLPEADLALPTVIVEVLPFTLGALLLASLFSAELSSADAILFMFSTSLTRDLYPRFFRSPLSEERLLRASRWISLSAGLLGVLLAVALEGVIQTLTIFYGLLSVSLFMPLIVGLYSRRFSAGTCLVSISLGLASALVYEAADAEFLIGATAVGILVSAAAFATAAAVRALSQSN